MIGQLGKAIATGSSGDPGRFINEACGKLQDVGDTNGMGEIGKHRLVIGRVAGKNHRLLDVIKGQAKVFGE